MEDSIIEYGLPYERVHEYPRYTYTAVQHAVADETQTAAGLMSQPRGSEE